MRRLAVIIDLDGTYVDNKHLLDQYLPMPNEIEDVEGYWSNFINESLYCDATLWCSRLVEDMIKAGVQLVFLTSRSGSKNNRALTKRWLEAVLPENTTYELYMREPNCRQKCFISKRNVLAQKIIPKYNITFAVDDQIDNIRMFESMGIKGLLCSVD